LASGGTHVVSRWTRAVREFWLAALIIFSGRAWLTYLGARIGLERAGVHVDLEGPILLKRATTMPGLPEPEPGNGEI